MSDRSAFVSESFKRRADSSAFWEAWAGAVLARKNLFTIHHPFTLAEEIGAALSHYASSWDLDVSTDGITANAIPIECKSVSLSFDHLPASYPHEGVLVCSDKSWQKKWPRTDITGRDFLIVSRVTGAILWLPRGTETGITQVTDKTRNETYACRTTHKSELRAVTDFVDHITRKAPK